jgi:hypothetical protein
MELQKYFIQQQLVGNRSKMKKLWINTMLGKLFNVLML